MHQTRVPIFQLVEVTRKPNNPALGKRYIMKGVISEMSTHHQQSAQEVEEIAEDPHINRNLFLKNVAEQNKS